MNLFPHTPPNSHPFDSKPHPHIHKDKGVVHRTRRHHSLRSTHRFHPYSQPIQPPNNDKPSPMLLTPPNSTDSNPTKLSLRSPTQARRLHQRRRQILFGKNTAGYEEYTRRIPPHSRMKNTMDHPTTPDYTVDRSVKRWQGLLTAWRRALHQFDPPNLTACRDEEIRLVPRTSLTKGEEEVERAKASGLQVAFGNLEVGEEECEQGFLEEGCECDSDDDVL